MNLQFNDDKKRTDERKVIHFLGGKQRSAFLQEVQTIFW